MKFSKLSMNLRNSLKISLFFLMLNPTPSCLQITAEIDVPEIQLLSSNLKPEECVKLVSFDSHTALSDAEIEKLAREESCFRRLVKWICQLRTITRNTYPVVNDFLERIGRNDLIACLAELRMKNSKSSKVIRDVQAAEDSEDYDAPTTVVSSTIKSQEKDTKQDNKSTEQSSNSTIAKIGGYTFKVSLKSASIVLLTTVLLSCCCTLVIRNRIARLCSKIFRRKKKTKLIPVNLEEERNVSRSYYVRKPRAKRKRAPSYEVVHTATQNNIVVEPKEPEEPPPTGCYKCYKKKRKKSVKRPRR